MTPSTKPRPPGVVCGRKHRHPNREQVAECDRRLAGREEAKRMASARQEEARGDQSWPVWPVKKLRV
jgi:hypothetical protein